ncbi:MAG: hypothetical protein DSM107014_01465 [Gomphosphaeria aponina SAG 52.96 = DSM 107014]|uniref:DDE Tnp4 domain-containing protein n=1 Tax=Gomphosphaeria aponina SAG 52.96 = DSM 107014 TaxID=1521640 RepID=A0A941GWL3_9CHRO|nr:hypothetical protein [Gomphosphaeria aponina SAG 52.96 = DSM 107014]
MKNQIIADPKTGLIVCTAQGKGKEHNFNIFKKSKILLNYDLEILGDKGYQGINKIHKNSKIPFKKPPKKDLDKEQINFNKTLGKERIIREHINRRLKIFQILSNTEIDIKGLDLD